jgi:hypothetical protein
MRLFFSDYRFRGGRKSNGKGLSQRAEDIRPKKSGLTLYAMLFAFLADLPADALGAIPAVSLRVGAGAAFLAVPLIIFLADGKGFPFWMVDAIHGFRPCLG